MAQRHDTPQDLWEFAAKAIPTLAVLLPFLGGLSRWISLLPDVSLPQEVRLAVPLGEMLATGIQIALVGMLVVAPLYLVGLWLLGTREQWDTSWRQEIAPLAEPIDSQSAKLTQRLGDIRGRVDRARDAAAELDIRKAALRARLDENPNLESDAAFVAEVRSVRQEDEKFRAELGDLEREVDDCAKEKDAVAEAFRGLRASVAELERRILPAPLRWTAALEEKAGVWGSRLTTILIAAAYVVSLPWYLLVQTTVLFAVGTRLMNHLAERRDYGRVLAVALLYALVTAVTTGMAPVQARLVDVTQPTAGIAAGSYLMLGRTDDLVYLRTCPGAMDLVAVRRSDVGPVRFIERPLVPQPSLAQLVTGTPLRLGTDTRACH